MSKDYQAYAFAASLRNKETQDIFTILAHCWARSLEEATSIAHRTLNEQYSDSVLSTKLLIREIEGAVYVDTDDLEEDSEVHWLDRDITMRSQ
jgi:hypothetical protein